MKMLFDVFGMKMSVERYEGEWRLYRESESSIKARVYDIYIPSDLDESMVGRFLADMYHEYATSKHPEVKRITP
ncbi:hypothetical protein [Vibrio sp. TBV020]|uniref:DUF7661 family protein n=1 Tax=Vibrio sp. TBV020 TaxID=3137398 RepID=UPI0038CD2BA5